MIEREQLAGIERAGTALCPAECLVLRLSDPISGESWGLALFALDVVSALQPCAASDDKEERIRR